MTSQEFEAISEDMFQRWLIRGELFERYDPETGCRNRFHAAALASIGSMICSWCQTQPVSNQWTGASLTATRLTVDPATILDADLMFFTKEVAAREPDDTQFFDGPPILVIEILSPHDDLQVILDKAQEFFNASTPMVWIVDPYNHTVTLYRSNTPPTMVNNTHKLENLPELPGFSVNVADLFQ